MVAKVLKIRFFPYVFKALLST